MKRPRNPTAADFRRLDRLVWSPGGVYESYLRSSWTPGMPHFLHRKEHSFRAFGLAWRMFFTVSVWRTCLDASISIEPQKLLEPVDTERIQSTGFYDDLSALVVQMGYSPLWVGPRGNSSCIRYLASIAEITPLQNGFETLDLTPPGPERGYRLTKSEERRQIDALLVWGRKQDRRTWSVCMLDMKTQSHESAGGIRWRTRRDVTLGPNTSCSWFFAWLPRRYTRHDWHRAERSGFFSRSAATFNHLGQKGHWRPECFQYSERYAAEFWKPERGDPKVTWHDFKALLDYRLR